MDVDNYEFKAYWLPVFVLGYFCGKFIYVFCCGLNVGSEEKE